LHSHHLTLLLHKPSLFSRPVTQNVISMKR
jgi:hypothetical protein